MVARQAKVLAAEPSVTSLGNPLAADQAAVENIVRRNMYFSCLTRVRDELAYVLRCTRSTDECLCGSSTTDQPCPNSFCALKGSVIPSLFPRLISSDDYRAFIPFSTPAAR